MVKPGLRRAAAVFLVALPSQRRQHHVLEAGLLPQSASDLVAIHPRRADV
jgi:hypothetical protein